jgi:hypothetical protein
MVANLARAVFVLCEQPCHPMLWNFTAPRTPPTSVTTTRKMCIDCLPLSRSNRHPD